jgi:hypothetical protein
MSMSDALKTPCAANALAASSTSFSRVRDASNGIARILRVRSRDALRLEVDGRARRQPVTITRAIAT